MSCFLMRIGRAREAFPEGPPKSKEASAVVDSMRERGVLLSTDGPLHNVIKIKPPMVLSEEDVDETLSKLGLCLSEI